MYEVSKCAPQEALRDLDRAFEHFFRREDSVQLPRLGRLRLKERGYLPTTGVRILSATVSERAGRWFVSIQVEEEIPDPASAQGEPIGVDLGIKALATCSDGVTYENPKALRQAQKKLRRLQRQLSRQKKGGRNREKTRRKIAQLHYRIANVRCDALHQATGGIMARTKPDVERPRVVVIEDLNVSGMLQNHHLARAISDVGMCEFSRQVMYKAVWGGSEVIVADRWYPSSKRCSACGAIKDELELSERVYECDRCGLAVDRDLNAARNLAQLATTKSTASSAESNACGEDVSLP